MKPTKPGLKEPQEQIHRITCNIRSARTRVSSLFSLGLVKLKIALTAAHEYVHRPWSLRWKNVDEIVHAASELPDVKVRSVFRMPTLDLLFQLRISPPRPVNVKYHQNWTLIEDPLILVHYFKYATTLERDKGDMSCVWRIRPVVAIQDRVVPQNNSLPFTSSSFFFGRTLSSQSKFKAAYVLGQLQNIAASDALSRVLKDVNEHPMVRHEAAEALGSIAVRGGNFNALTNEWVDLGYVYGCVWKCGKPEHGPSNRCVCMERSDDVKGDIEQNCCEHVLIVVKRTLAAISILFENSVGEQEEALVWILLT
ncbi:deoxyhypusine hydroxylase-B [Tanacetum coccineum]|uniref:Deoxyhypusine hydroxylase-B n=1 Tax=Tanacetum coccineum TaxID=301880 RepID=A0ABQ5DRW8_9ASTR